MDDSKFLQTRIAFSFKVKVVIVKSIVRIQRPDKWSLLEALSQFCSNFDEETSNVVQMFAHSEL